MAGRPRRRPRCTGRSTGCAGWPRTTGPAATSWRPPSPWPMPAGTTGRMGRRAAGGVRRVPGPHRGQRRRGPARGDLSLAPVRLRTKALAERTGRATPLPGGQARPRRPLQRGRADRRGRPRRRLRGHLPGHPADAGPDRGGRPRRGRRRRRAVHPLGLPPGAGARRGRPPAGRRSRRRPSWWAASSRPRTPRSSWARAWPPSTRRRTSPSTRSWRTWWRWPNASAPPFPRQPGHLAPGHRHGAQRDGPTRSASGRS